MYKTLVQILKALPNVMPIKASKAIRLALSDNSEPSRKIGERNFTEEEINEIIIEDSSYYGITIRTSPVGARLLIELYKKCLLPMHKNCAISDIPVEIINYAQRDESHKQDNEKEKRFRYLVDNPEEIQESDFSYELLDQVIYKHRGPCSRSMILANIKVSKNVTTYRSNSGKTSDSTVQITWTDSKGEQQCFRKDSIYEGNRRSDPERNWGLGRD